MPRWLDRLLDDLGRHVIRHGWADPNCSIPPMIISDDLDAMQVIDDDPSGDQEFTANSSR